MSSVTPENRTSALIAAICARVVVADGATGSLLDLLLGDAHADRRDLVALELPEVAASVHRAYLVAGAEILKTATFNASARGLTRFAGSGTGGTGGTENLARQLNEASARLARAAADEAEKSDGRPRWVAGSVGPGSDAPSLGGCSYQELRASYLPQFLGLIAGGADLALIETVQDTLQCKAAIGAMEEAGRFAGRKLPFIASATVDARGRMLSGASPAAFTAIVEPFGPLAIGLNCSGGPDELEPAFRALARVSSAPICIMPNAGLPRSVDGKVSWPLDAEGFAQKTAAIARRLGAGIVGGCCGTGPDHIAALVRAMTGAAAPAPRPRKVFALASAFEAISSASTEACTTVEGGASFLVIDERSNASGSVAFKTLVKSGDLDAAARFAVDRAAKGPAAVDISVAGATKDEAASLAAIVARVASVAGAALSIDTTDPAVLEAVLPFVGGRPLINSVNLEDAAKAARTFELAREYGAAVVCLAMDETGPARTSETKLAICQRLYALALAQGLAPQDLLFDTCTFPVGSGDKSLAFSAAETIAAVGGLALACPGSGSVLGVGNCSFGLPKALRPAFTSRFTAAARAAGLGAAIVDPAALARAVPEGFSDAADALIDARAGADGYGAAIERLLTFAPAAAESANAADSAAAQSDAAQSTAEAAKQCEPGSLQALSAAIIAGNAAGAASTVSLMTGSAVTSPESSATPASTASSISSTDIAGAIAGAMAELGRRYDAGAIALPLVLRSADAARDAFGALRAAPGRTHPAGSRVVLSTVRGDLHDIGKNLVGMVLEAAGFDVVDLGTDRNADDIAKAAADAGALAVGVSGLLTRSLVEMEKVAKALEASGSTAILLCGGAAVDREYVADRIEPVRPGLVAYARDPFEAVGILEKLKRAPAPAPGSPGNPIHGSAHGPAQPAATANAGTGSDPESLVTDPKAALVEGPAFIPSFLGSAAMDSHGFEKLLAALDVNAVVRSRWGYADKAEGQSALDEAVAALRLAGGVEATCRYGYFRTTKPEPEVIEFHTSAAHSVPFRFPREATGEQRSIADFYADDDMAAAFCVTLGRRATDYLAGLKAARDSSAYLRAHGLLAGLAEAAAEITHNRISLELSGRGAASSGKRYSFGFPGCPGVEANAPLLDLLGGAQIGLRTTEGHQLDPEFSVTALVIQRAQARYLRA